MNDDMIFTPSEEGDQAVFQNERKKMRTCFNRCGWSLFVLIGFWLLLMTGLSAFVGFAAQSDSSLIALYNKYFLLINEATLAIAIVVSLVVLRSVPKAPFEKRPFSVKHFLVVLVICFAAGSAGNVIGNMWLSVWNALTGNEASNEVILLMMEMEPWQIFLSAGILAPILEELFFRKLLIDRMRPYGELTCMLVSGFFFGLFHQNFSQFFYAFGVGVLLAYVYYRSGKYWLTVLLHLIFNVIGGVLPSLFVMKLAPYLEALETVSDENLLSLTLEYALPILLYLILVLVMGTLTIAGILCLIFYAKNFRPEKGCEVLSAKEKRKAVFLNPGVIVACAFLVVMTILSLFTA